MPLHTFNHSTGMLKMTSKKSNNNSFRSQRSKSNLLKNKHEYFTSRSLILITFITIIFVKDQGLLGKLLIDFP